MIFLNGRKFYHICEGGSINLQPDTFIGNVLFL